MPEPNTGASPASLSGGGGGVRRSGPSDWETLEPEVSQIDGPCGRAAGATRALCWVDVTVRGKGSQGRPDRQRGKRQNTSLKPQPRRSSSSKQEASKQATSKQAGKQASRKQASKQAGRKQARRQTGRPASPTAASKAGFNSSRIGAEKKKKKVECAPSGNE